MPEIRHLGGNRNRRRGDSPGDDQPSGEVTNVVVLRSRKLLDQAAIDVRTPWAHQP
jgi:hypothetical protein